MTTTELAVPDQGAALTTFTPTSPDQITAALEQWVGGMAASVQGAEYIVDTPMCPDAFWPLPAGTKSKFPKQMLPNEDRDSYLARRRVAAYTLGSVVRYGLQLGLPPEVAVQGIFTVGGRMSMYAEQMVALIKRHGHEHRVTERTATRCAVEVRRRGTDRWIEFEFTIEQAIEAGYVPKKGPNANPGTWPDGKPKEGGGNAKYLTDPAAMLYARASSIACRTEFPDVLRGLVTYEEMLDEQRAAPVDVHVEVVEPQRPRASAILAAAAPAEPEAAPVAVVEPERPAPPTEPDPVTRAVLPVTDAQLRKLGAVFTDLGVKGKGERAGRLAVASRITGRTLASSKELTLDEARTLIDTLEANGPAIAAEVLGWADEPAAPVDEPVGDEAPVADVEVQDPPANPEGW